MWWCCRSDPIMTGYEPYVFFGNTYIPIGNTSEEVDRRHTQNYINQPLIDTIPDTTTPVMFVWDYSKDGKPDFDLTNYGRITGKSKNKNLPANFVLTKVIKKKDTPVFKRSVLKNSWTRQTFLQNTQDKNMQCRISQTKGQKTKETKFKMCNILSRINKVL